jgi:hypothetical protein
MREIPMQDQIDQARMHRREGCGEPASAPEAAEPPPAGSISFTIATGGRGTHIRPLLDTLEQARHGDDEVILLISQEHVDTVTYRPPWLRIVGIPGASVFRLRSFVPVACRKEWVIMLEDHSLIDSNSIEAIRRVIRERPKTDMIPVLTKNLTSREPWGWAIFLYNFARVWAPLDHPPPFSIVTSAIVRRAALGEARLQDGEWELQLLPKIFATGKPEYSNDIFIDHVKPLGVVPTLTLIFNNARAGAALQRSFGASARTVLREGLYAFISSPRRHMTAVTARRHELPSGMQVRLHALGFMHLVGNLTALLFGSGRAAYKVD